jgi:hypothetical protein
VHATGTAPVRAEVESTVAITVTSATVTIAPELDAEPVSLRLGSSSTIVAGRGTSDYRFADPGPQQLTVAAGVVGPLTIGGSLSVVLALASPGSGPATTTCALTSPTPVTVAVDLPADGSRQAFHLAATCSVGTQGFATVRLGGIAPTRVTPGERPRLVADVDAHGGMIVQSNVVLGVSGASGADSFSLSIPRSDPGVELLLPPAGTGGNVTVSIRQISGTTFHTGPDGAPISAPYTCPVGVSPANTPVVIPVSDPTTTTTTTSSTTTTTTTTRPAPRPICRLTATLPAPLRRLLVALFRLDC